jgi:hypothetical protein
MAQRLKEFDFSEPSTLTTTDKAVYPWEQWFDGDVWELTWGEDFHGHPLMMERIIRTRATGRHAKVSLRHLPMNGDPWGILVIQRTDIDGPTQVKKEAKAAKMAATKAANAKANGKMTAPPAKHRIVRKRVAVPA